MLCRKVDSERPFFFIKVIGIGLFPDGYRYQWAVPEFTVPAHATVIMLGFPAASAHVTINHRHRVQQS